MSLSVVYFLRFCCLRFMFDELANEGDKIFVLKLHPQLIGRSSRVRMLERFIAYMKANGAWLASCEEVARYVKDFYAKRAEGGEA